METTGKRMVRYADDFVVMCRSREEAESTLSEIRAWAETAGLTLHPENARIVDVNEPGGFDFPWDTTSSEAGNGRARKRASTS